MTSNRYYSLLASALLYLCLGCFWIRHDFVSAGSWQLGVIMLGLGAIAGGLLQERWDPAHVGWAGAALFGLGFVGAGLGSSPTWHYATLDVLIGGGSGMAYSAGIPLIVRWFPDRVGLAIGATVAGYVPASFLGGAVAQWLIERIGSRGAAQVTGVGLSLLAFASILVLRAAPVTSATSVAADGESGPGQMLRAPRFRSLWLSYALASTGAMTIYAVLPGSLSQLSDQGGRAAAGAMAALLGPVSQIANAGARIVAGELCDLVGGAKTLSLAVSLILLGGVLALYAWPPVTLLAAFTVLAGYGAMLAIFPVLTATLFGLRHLGANYGLVFSAWAIGYVAGVTLGPTVVRAFDRYSPAFWVAASICIVALWFARKTHADEADAVRLLSNPVRDRT